MSIRTSVFILILTSAIFVRVQAQSKPWIAPPDAKSLKNPIPGDAITLKEGGAIYTANCTPCHGTKGKGDGPAAAALDPKPADHTSVALLSETDGSLFYKISEGRKPMPQYKTTFTEKQRWELVDYIRTLNKTPKK
ncbi:MAG: cytochrome c [Bacteroidota bacterium]|nr:cytochrome c [Bacteroidota bacterium]